MPLITNVLIQIVNCIWQQNLLALGAITFEYSPCKEYISYLAVVIMMTLMLSDLMFSLTLCHSSKEQSRYPYSQSDKSLLCAVVSISTLILLTPATNAVRTIIFQAPMD